VRIIWTTNFDQLLERAFSLEAVVSKLPRALSVASLENPEKAAGLIRDEVWPVLVKLHGDYLYKRLKNTKVELQKQDERPKSAAVPRNAPEGQSVDCPR